MWRRNFVRMDFGFCKSHRAQSKTVGGQLCNTPHTSGLEAFLSPSALFNIHGKAGGAEGLGKAEEGCLI